MELTETVVPAQNEKQHWHGESVFTLSEGDLLKIESIGADRLRFEVPAPGCRVEMTLTITKL